MNFDSDTSVSDEFHDTRSRWDHVVLPPDDVRVGMYVSLFSIKGEDQFTDFHGLACKVLAVNYPNVFGYYVMNPDMPAIFDFRYHELTEVGEAFAKAQLPGSQVGTGGVPPTSAGKGNAPRRRKGVVLAPEELRAGQLVSLYALESHDRFTADHGKTCKVLAVSLPYVTGYYVLNSRGPVRYDLRYHEVMETDEAYGNAQVLFAQSIAGHRFDDRSGAGKMK